MGLVSSTPRQVVSTSLVGVAEHGQSDLFSTPFRDVQGACALRRIVVGLGEVTPC